MAKSHTINPIFRRYSKRVTDQARSVARGSEVGRLVGQVEKAVRSGGGSSLTRILNTTPGGFDPSQLTKQMRGTDMLQTAKVLAEHYAKGGASRKAVDLILGDMGPGGRVMADLVKRGGGKSAGGEQQQLSFMQNLLEAFGISSHEVKKKPTGSRTSAMKAQRGRRKGRERAKEWLASMGYPVEGEPDDPVQAARKKKQAEPPILPQGKSSTTAKGTPRRYVDLKVGGRNKRYPIDHPIVTGAMLPAAGSSNVHSFGYDIDTTTLYIRFLQDEGYGRKGGKGPLYAYFHVQPPLFTKMMAAVSKGKFIWKHIRIEKTISGHRFGYKLVGVEKGYVPRKATVQRVGDRLTEVLAERQVLTTGGTLMKSRPGTLNPYSSGAPKPPNRGTPNRATPNRGR